jgi:hypothetical protein
VGGYLQGPHFAIWFLHGTHLKGAETVWVVPIPSSEFRVVPDGKRTVIRSRDAGRSWQRAARGLPDRNAQLLELREAISVDSADRAGVFFGTPTGQVFYKGDAGLEWQLLAHCLPPLYSVEAFGPFD